MKLKNIFPLTMKTEELVEELWITSAPITISLLIAHTSYMVKKKLSFPPSTFELYMLLRV